MTDFLNQFTGINLSNNMYEEEDRLEEKFS